MTNTTVERLPLLPRRMQSALGQKFLWRTGGIFVAAGMITGAFGAHGLKKKPDMTAENIHAWETAANYLVYNGLGLLAISLNPRFASHKFAGPAITCGGLMFSGTIFALVLNRDRFKFLGPVTPLGGILMIAGYLALVL